MLISVGFECFCFQQGTIVNGAVILANWEISDLEMLLKSSVLSRSQWLHLAWFQKSDFKISISVLTLANANKRQGQGESLWKGKLDLMSDNKSQKRKD